MMYIIQVYFQLVSFDDDISFLSNLNFNIFFLFKFYKNQNVEDEVIIRDFFFRELGRFDFKELLFFIFIMVSDIYNLVFVKVIGFVQMIGGGSIFENNVRFIYIIIEELEYIMVIYLLIEEFIIINISKFFMEIVRKIMESSFQRIRELEEQVKVILVL